ncbi:MAG: hypothetical protein KatS3mg131_0934 [Candidatus Tectimicrobiota bacterium]|nr:MAG: hypothetical protein KatS3mg131_0934 [Candidatus Tectomicrobia bacterium]
MSGGGASLAMQTFLTVSADGTFSYGSARAVGGGETPWGTWGVDTGTGGDTMSGRWRTADRILYLLHPTTGQWVPAARYYVEGNQLLLYLPDGSRELWYRQP